MRNSTSGPGGRVLGICIANWSFGEATLGMRLVNAADFEAVHFLISPLQAPIFRYYKVPYTTLPGNSKLLNAMSLESLVQRFAPDEILVADPLTFTESHKYYGLEGDQLFSFGVPVSGIDIYAIEDDFGPRQLPTSRPFPTYKKLLSSMERLYRPCPLYDPRQSLEAGADPRNQCYSTLLGETPAQAKRCAGGGPDKPLRVVMTCAAWEDKLPLSEGARNMRDCVRSHTFALLEELSRHRKVHVDIVGMASMEDFTDGCSFDCSYHSVVAPSIMRQLMQEADLYYSTNVIATTITLALSVGTPVVCLRNSSAFTYRPAEGHEALARESEVQPFLVNPIGWSEFLEPLLRRSRFSSCILPLEMQAGPEEGARAILNWAEGGASDAEPLEYLNEIRALPRLRLGLGERREARKGVA